MSPDPARRSSGLDFGLAVKNFLAALKLPVRLWLFDKSLRPMMCVKKNLDSRPVAHRKRGFSFISKSNLRRTRVQSSVFLPSPTLKFIWREK